MDHRSRSRTTLQVPKHTHHPELPKRPRSLDQKAPENKAKDMRPALFYKDGMPD